MGQKLRKVDGPVRVPSSTAPGFRERLHGTPDYVGNSGYSWSSAPNLNSINGMLLGFNTADVNPGSTHNRGYGFQLRCLSE